MGIPIPLRCAFLVNRGPSKSMANWKCLTQIAQTLRSTLIRHQSDIFTSDLHLIDIDLRVFAIWVRGLFLWILLIKHQHSNDSFLSSGSKPLLDPLLVIWCPSRVNSLKPDDPYMLHWTGSVLIQVMACCLLRVNDMHQWTFVHVITFPLHGAKPLPASKLVTANKTLWKYDP